MNLVFVVPLENRGTMIQAKAVQEWCRRNGHRVVRVLQTRADFANTSPRNSPDSETASEIIPGAGTPTRIDRNPSVTRWLWQNLGRRRALRAGMAAIDRAIETAPAGAIVSFMEPLAALHRLVGVRGTPLLTVGHALRLAHPDQEATRRASPEARRIARRARWCSTGGIRYALSLEPLANHPGCGWFAGPPLLGGPIPPLPQSPGQGLVIRLGRAEQRTEVERWHEHHPGMVIDCFYDRSETVGTEVVRSTLRFHPLDRDLFRECLSRCSGVVMDGGTEELAEAACFGKPILHWLGRPQPELLLAALDAERAGISRRMTHFNPGRFKEAGIDGTEAFRRWMETADDRLRAAMASLERECSRRG